MGERKVWSVCHIPDTDAEDRRHLHRELLELKDERTRHINRLKGLLANQAIALAKVDATFPDQLEALRRWDGSELGPDLQSHLRREYARWQFVDRQIKDLENERRKRMRRDETAPGDQVRRLLELAGIGLNGAWLLVYELFGWRQIANRKQLGALVGRTPTPYQLGVLNQYSTGRTPIALPQFVAIEAIISGKNHEAIDIRQGSGRKVPGGARVAAAFKKTMKIVFDEFLPKWNYTAVPESS